MIKSIRFQYVQELARENGFFLKKNFKKKYYILKNIKINKTLRFHVLCEVEEYLVKSSQRWLNLAKIKKN